MLDAQKLMPLAIASPHCGKILQRSSQTAASIEPGYEVGVALRAGRREIAAAGRDATPPHTQPCTGYLTNLATFWSSRQPRR